MIRSEHKRHIVDYFKKNMPKGYPAESLKWALINQGYLRMEVLKALEQAHKELADEAPVLKEKPQIKYEFYDENDNSFPAKISWWGKVKKWFG